MENFISAGDAKAREKHYLTPQAKNHDRNNLISNSRWHLLD
jgi:hypothetical protein